MKLIITVLLLIILIVLISLGAVPFSHYIKSILEWNHHNHLEQQTIELLHRDTLEFLVTDKIMTSIVVETIDENLLWGKREGYLIATVKVYIGIDLKKIDESNISREQDKIIVEIPEPELLDFAVDYERTRMLTKRSGFFIITDLILNRDMRDELYQKLKTATVEQLSEYRMFPSREELVARLNQYSTFLGSQLGGIELVFI